MRKTDAIWQHLLDQEKDRLVATPLPELIELAGSFTTATILGEGHSIRYGFSTKRPR
jgi:hypothetical protein